MPIYDKPVRLLIPEMARDLANPPGRIFSKPDAITWFRDHYPDIKEATITAHLIRFSTNAPSRRHYNATPDEDLFYQIDGSHFRLYQPADDPTPIHANADAHTGPGQTADGLDGDDLEGIDDAYAGEFAYERDLKNFLARNLSLIEPGLRLYEDEGITGVEFPVGGRFVDILAVDAHDNLVVIELKVSRGYDRVVGQLLRYMAWIESHHAEPGQEVRGIIIARQISEDLKLACSRVRAVALFEYELSVSLRSVTTE